jgi:hypothetical protein
LLRAVNKTDVWESLNGLKMTPKMREDGSNSTNLLYSLNILFFFFSSPLALQPAVGFGMSNNIPPFFSYLSPTLSIFSLLALEELFLLPLSIFSWVFPYVSSLPVLE